MQNSKQKKREKPKVLVIDDEPDVCEILRDFLKQNGCYPLVAYSGKQALSKVKRHKPQIVLIDLAMPGMHGLDVLRNIKNIDKRIQIILITAYRDAEKVVEAFRLGASDCIFKPFDFEYLKKAIFPLLS